MGWGRVPFGGLTTRYLSISVYSLVPRNFFSGIAAGFTSKLGRNVYLRGSERLGLSQLTAGEAARFAVGALGVRLHGVGVKPSATAKRTSHKKAGTRSREGLSRASAGASPHVRILGVCRACRFTCLPTSTKW